MVAGEGFHDRGLVQELDSLSQAGRLVHSLHRHVHVPFALDDVLANALVDHAERALTQFPQNVDLVSGHLPLVRLIHCRHILQEYYTFDFTRSERHMIKQVSLDAA